MSTRAELISDWQTHLTAAEQSAGCASSLRWLIAARVRLYRFLLSLYGDGGWNADSLAEPRSAAGGAAVVIDSLEALPFYGKPAKTAGKIQSVLKSVANANDAPPPAGPLVEGLEPGSWMLVATTFDRTTARIHVDWLRKHAIEARFAAKGYRFSVEVPAAYYREALPLMRNRRIAYPKVFLAHRESKFLAIVIYYVVITGAVGPCIGLFAMLAWSAIRVLFGETPDRLEMVTVFLIAWSLAIAAGAVLRCWLRVFDVLRPLSSMRRQQPVVIVSRKRSPKGEAIWAFLRRWSFLLPYCPDVRLPPIALVFGASCGLTLAMFLPAVLGFQAMIPWWAGMILFFGLVSIRRRFAPPPVHSEKLN